MEKALRQIAMLIFWFCAIWFAIEGQTVELLLTIILINTFRMRELLGEW
jgi:hypothetical protein